jgi:hypothetical protein
MSNWMIPRPIPVKQVNWFDICNSLIAENMIVKFKLQQGLSKGGFD